MKFPKNTEECDSIECLECGFVKNNQLDSCLNRVKLTAAFEFGLFVMSEENKIMPRREAS